MALFFLDPLALTAMLCLVAYCWVVWRGHFRRWLGRDDWWTIVAWPLPLLVLVVPMGAAGIFSAMQRVGLGFGDGGVDDALLYAILATVPLSGLTLLPPAWLLPRWARERLRGLPPREQPLDAGAAPALPSTDPGAIPALRAARGHGSLARWAWRVDAVPGMVGVENGHLRFRAATEGRSGNGAGELVPLPDEDGLAAELRIGPDGELYLEAPRGGWWSRDHLDIELSAVDRSRVHATRPWRRDGVLTLEVEGRRPVHLWLPEVAALHAEVLHARPTA